MVDSKKTGRGVGFERRHPLRRVMQWMAWAALNLLTHFKVEGIENIPSSGPLLMVGNHFSFIDPVTFVAITPWPLDFVGGAVFPHAPKILHWIPRLWGVYPLYRGTGSTYALKAAQQILAQGGVIGIFPEGGNWAEVLRPARPGTAFLAARTGARILPVGIDGLNDVFPALARFKRAEVTLRIGEPFGPFTAPEKGTERRERLNEIGHQIMRQIAALLPPDKRGHYSDDPAVRAAAQGTEHWPWAEQVEGKVEGEVH